MVSVDRWDFERAVVDRDAARVISLYSGPFLFGFHINGLAEFERWNGREMLAHAHMDALTSLALGADARGLPGAISWRVSRRSRPLNDVNAQKCIRALAMSGDVAGALHHARVHEALVARELDLKPSPAFQRFVQEIRAGLVPANGTAAPRSPVVTPPFAVQAIAMTASVQGIIDPPLSGNGHAPRSS
jgi:hypothetical protein